jgi:hypothetical protein
MAFLFGLACISFLVEMQTAVVLLGAMIIHYAFDIVDDYLSLGEVNPNWKRWGREKKSS